MTNEEKIKILKNEIASRKMQIVTVESEIETFEMLIKNVDYVTIDEDNISYDPPKEKTHEEG